MINLLSKFNYVFVPWKPQFGQLFDTFSSEFSSFPIFCMLASQFLDGNTTRESMLCIGFFYFLKVIVSVSGSLEINAEKVDKSD